MILCIAT